jgi:hypothetical protein
MKNKVQNITYINLEMEIKFVTKVFIYYLIFSSRNIKFG